MCIPTQTEISENIDDDPIQVSEDEDEVELPMTSALLQSSSVGFTFSEGL